MSLLCIKTVDVVIAMETLNLFFDYSCILFVLSVLLIVNGLIADFVFVS